MIISCTLKYRKTTENCSRTGDGSLWFFGVKQGTVSCASEAVSGFTL